MNLNDLSEKIIGCAITVHRKVGSGLLEDVYQKCLEHELKKNNLNIESQYACPVYYDDMIIKTGYMIDILVEKKIVLELKSIEKITEVHKSQLLTYLKNGIYRLINSPISIQNSAPSALNFVNSV